MSNYNNTKATIAANVYTNHANQVTAEMVKTAINAVVDTIIAGGFLYKGVAIPTTNPGSPDANVAYIAATAGTYTNFGGLVVADGEVAVLKYNGSWSKEVTGAATAAQVAALGQEVGENYLTTLIDAGKVFFERGTFTASGGISASTTRIRCTAALPTTIGWIGVPNGFLIHEVYYYSSWTDDNNFTFVGPYKTVGLRYYKIDTTQPLFRFSIRKANNSSILVEDFMQSISLISPELEQEIIRLKMGNGYTTRIPVTEMGSKYIAIPKIVSGHTYLVQVSADTSIRVDQPSFSTGTSSSSITDYISKSININVIQGMPSAFLLKATADATYFHYYLEEGTLDNLLFEILDVDGYESLIKEKENINVAFFGTDGAAIVLAISYAQYVGASRIYIPNGTYLFDSGITIPADFSVVGESRDGVILKASASFPADELLTISSRTRLSNLTIDANSKSLTCVYGYHISDSFIENVVAKNVAAVTSSRHLIYIKTSKNVTIKDCVLHDISHKASGGSARGISFQNSFYCSALNCEIYNILRLDPDQDETESATIDADGVWVHTDNEESFSGNVIEKCNIYDCRGRFVKIQQWGVTIRDCHLHKDSGLSVEAIGVYDSYTTIENCTIEHPASLTIHIGGTSLTDGANEFIKIIGNNITHKGTAYQAAIMVRDRPARNVIISGNIINVVSLTDDVFQVRCGSNYRTGMYGDYSIVDNQILGDPHYLLHARMDEFTSSYLRGLLIANNNCLLHTSVVGMDGADDSHFLAGSILGNRGSFSSSSVNNVIDATDGFKKKFTYDGNYFGSTIIDGFRTIGTTAQRPTGISAGFQYFDTTLGKYICYDGTAWVNMDGSAL